MAMTQGKFIWDINRKSMEHEKNMIVFAGNYDSGTHENWRYMYHICLAYFSSLCKGIFPQNMARNMVRTYLHSFSWFVTSLTMVFVGDISIANGVYHHIVVHPSRRAYTKGLHA